MSDNYLIPIFIINGQLESGKTTFIKELIKGEQFKEAKEKLVIVCEDGEEEYETEKFEKDGYRFVYLSKEEFTREKLEELEKKYSPWIVIVEYNGMWDFDFIDAVKKPKAWSIYQIITIIDATTFLLKWKNMKSIMADNIRFSEVILFNRCKNDMDLLPLLNAVKSLNQNANIMFENENGEILKDTDIFLPYDVESNEIVLKDEHFGIWFLDAKDHKEKYDGKKIKTKVFVLKDETLKENEFVGARQAINCCEDDSIIIGYICKNTEKIEQEMGDWINITGTIKYEKHEIYDNLEAPIIYVEKIEKTKKPLENYIVF